MILIKLVIFCWHISHLLDFDTTDMISFDTKYIFFIRNKLLETLNHEILVEKEFLNFLKIN